MSGAIITKLGQINPVMHGYGIEYWPGDGSDTRHNHYAIARSPEAALFEALIQFGVSGESVGWIVCDSMTKKTARRLGVRLRKRAPGAGRPAATVERKRVTVWLTPTAHDHLKAVAKAEGRTAGEQIEHWLNSG